MKTALLISGTVLMGCTGGEPDQHAAQSTAALDDDLPRWVPDQGTHILGSKADDIASPGGYVRVAAVPTFFPRFTLSVTPALQGAHLVATTVTVINTITYTGNDPWFNGLILTASDGGQIRINSSSEVTAQDLGFEYVASTAASTVYMLDYRPSNGDGTFGPWEDYCDGQGGAIALRGAYNFARDHIDPPVGAISFACSNAISYKCNMWGYGAGNLGPSSTPWQYHQACTAAGNARYCDDGHSFTREETPIRLIDARPNYGIDDPGPRLEHLSRDDWPGGIDNYYIESGWTAEGKPMCLSKLRWVSMPPKPCPGVFEDPRFRRSDDTVYFCDDFTLADLFAKGAVLVVGSKMMDARIVRWAKSDGSDAVSTIRGFVIDADEDGVPDANSYFPFPDANHHSEYTSYVGPDGLLLRNLPDSVDPADTTMLYMQNLLNSGDHYISDRPGLLGRTGPAFEGYVFSRVDPQTDENHPIDGLRRFTECTRSASGHDDHDTHLNDPAHPSTDCTNLRDLGYAFPSP
jgi:hypothetical protein